VPQRGKRGTLRPTIRSLATTVISQKENLVLSIENLLSEMKSERPIPITNCGTELSDANSQKLQKLEMEASAKRIEVEK
jgi:hypothetical protein